MSSDTKKKVTFGGIVHALFTAVVYVLIAAMILVAAGMMICKVQGKTFFLAGKSIMWIMTGSMDDEMNHTIPTQSYVLMEKVTDPNTLEVGDIICFRSEDPTLANMSTNLVVHRIIGIIEADESSTGKREFITKGDANYVQDNYTAKADNVVAKHLQNLPLMSFFGRLLASVYGIILIAIIVVASIFTIYIPELKRRAADDAAEEEAAEEAERRAEMQRLIAAEVEKLKQQQSQQTQQPEQAQQAQSENPSPDQTNN